MANEKWKKSSWCLALATMLLACGSGGDDGGSSGAAGTGGTRDSGTDGRNETTSDAASPTSSDGTMCGIAGGACVNATDCAIDRSQLDPKVGTCARSCTGSSKCTADCLHTGGLTVEC